MKGTQDILSLIYEGSDENKCSMNFARKDRRERRRTRNLSCKRSSKKAEETKENKVNGKGHWHSHRTVWNGIVRGLKRQRKKVPWKEVERRTNWSVRKRRKVLKIILIQHFCLSFVSATFSSSHFRLLPYFRHRQNFLSQFLSSLLAFRLFACLLKVGGKWEEEKWEGNKRSNFEWTHLSSTQIHSLLPFSFLPFTFPLNEKFSFQE